MLDISELIKTKIQNCFPIFFDFYTASCFHICPIFSYGNNKYKKAITAFNVDTGLGSLLFHLMCQMILLLR